MDVETKNPENLRRRSSSIIDRKICYICDTGSEKILDSYEFNECHHYYCVYCLFRNLFLNHINELIEQSEITVKCKCNKGKKKFSFDEIKDIIKFKSDIKENDEKPICREHDSNCELFCKNCQKYICYHCRSGHKSHKIVQNSIFVRMYKDFIKGMPLKFKYSENFKLNLDKSVDKFNKDLAEKTSSAIKEIDEFIEDLHNIKKNYILKLKEIQENGLQSINLIKSFYYEYYSDLSNIETDNDIFSLRYLASYKKELDNFEMKYNVGIFPKLEDVHTNIKILKSLIDQPFSLKMNYIDVPTTFREVIRTIGHDDQINCLSRIGDSQFISGSNNSIKFWNLEEEELRPYECLDKFIDEVGCLLLLKDSRLCFSSLRDNWIKIYEKITTFSKDEDKNNSENNKGNDYITLSEHSKSVTSLIQLDNNNLVSSARDDKIIVWEMKENNFVKCFEMKDVHRMGEKGGVYSLCKIENNNFISGGFDGKIKYWKKHSAKNEYKLFQEFGNHNDKVRYLITLKENNLCSASSDGAIKVWTKKDDKFQLFWDKEMKDEIITCLAGLKNGSFITGSSSTSLTKHGIYANMRVWEKTGNNYSIKENIKKHFKQITSVIELDWGNVVSAGIDGVIIVWKSGVLYD